MQANYYWIDQVEGNIIEALADMDKAIEQRNREEYFYQQGVAVGLQRSLTLFMVTPNLEEKTKKRINGIWKKYTDLIFKPFNKREA